MDNVKLDAAFRAANRTAQDLGIAAAAAIGWVDKDGFFIFHPMQINPEGSPEIHSWTGEALTGASVTMRRHWNKLVPGNAWVVVRAGTFKGIVFVTRAIRKALELEKTQILLPTMTKT